MTQYEIELNNLPNQRFTTTINNIDMEITLKLAGQNHNPVMLFSLSSGGAVVCPFVPCFANQGLLPYPYMIEQVGGNFIFITNDDEYPNYTEFGNTQSLCFVTIDELING